MSRTTPLRRDCDHVDVETVCSHDSMVSIEVEQTVTCCRSCFAFLVWAPLMFLASFLTTVGIVVQQMLVLPFRVIGGRCLTLMLHLTAAPVVCLICLSVSVLSYEHCYGRMLADFSCVSDFLEAVSASRRKNIKRNLKRSQEVIQSKGIEVTYQRAGTWRCTHEMRQLLWEQCEGHAGTTFGAAAIVLCGRPWPSRNYYYGALVFILCFPCDVQLFRDQAGRLISFNTRAHIGNMYCNPNYATRTDHAKDGIYAFSNRHMMSEAIRVRASIINVMPAMRSAKGQLGLRPLAMRSIFAAAFIPACRRPRHPDVQDPEYVSRQEPAEPQQPVAPKGRKRAARKKAAAEAARREAESPAGATAPLLKDDTSDQRTSASFLSTEASSIATPMSTPSFIPVPKGGKRAARKRAAADRAAAEKASIVAAGEAGLEAGEKVAQTSDVAEPMVGTPEVSSSVLTFDGKVEMSSSVEQIPQNSGLLERGDSVDEANPARTHFEGSADDACRHDEATDLEAQQNRAPALDLRHDTALPPPPPAGMLRLPLTKADVKE